MAKSKKSGTKKSSAKKAEKKKKVKKASVKKALKKKTVKKSTKLAKKKETMTKKTAPKKKTMVKKIAKKKVAKAVPKKVSAKKIPVKKGTVKHVTAETIEVKSKRIESIKGYSKRDLEHFKQIILEKRDEIIEQLQNLKEQMLDPTTGEYINENSPYSLHMAEQGTDAMEREKTFLYAQRENKFLGYLEDALKRIDAGTYGICIECVDEPQYLCETCPLVPKARLEAVPHSQLCLPMKQRQEKNR
jgi:DnaK suppressor protein